MKKLIAALLLLLLVLGGVSFLLPRRVVVLHSTQLAASPDVLFELISTPREWRAWAPWGKEATLRGSVSGPVTGVGARWDWSSDSEPGAWLVFTRAIPSATVSFNLQSAQFGAATTSVVQLAPNNQGTVVQWQLTADLGNSPLQRWRGIGLSERLRAQMEQAMQALNAYSRDLPPTAPIMGRELRTAPDEPEP